MNKEDALLAAVTCPKFKLRWLKDEQRREQLRDLLTAECRKIVPDDEASVPLPVPTTSHCAESDFFEFEAEQESYTYSIEQEVVDYLRSGYEIESVNKFSNIRKMFLKYNAPTPSSAPVERLFSLGGLVLNPKRNRLSDKRFERLVLMRYNHSFTT